MPDEADGLLDIAAGGIPAASLPPEPEALGAAERLGDEALAGGEKRERSMEELRALTARHPDALSGWAALGRAALADGDALGAYAFYRVAYHRGLDKARASGWRGDGRVPWEIPANRPFLRAVHGLAQCAAAIGESAEAERCAAFLGTLDPNHPL